jgi:ankyrin repeat protein
MGDRPGDRPGTPAEIYRDANIRAKNNHGDTALMQAAVSGKTEVVKLLQDKGAH